MFIKNILMMRKWNALIVAQRRSNERGWCYLSSSVAFECNQFLSVGDKLDLTRYRRIRCIWDYTNSCPAKRISISSDCNMHYSWTAHIQRMTLDLKRTFEYVLMLISLILFSIDIHSHGIALKFHRVWAWINHRGWIFSNQHSIISSSNFLLFIAFHMENASFAWIVSVSFCNLTLKWREAELRI